MFERTEAIQRGVEDDDGHEEGHQNDPYEGGDEPAPVGFFTLFFAQEVPHDHRIGHIEGESGQVDCGLDAQARRQRREDLDPVFRQLADNEEKGDAAQLPEHLERGHGPPDIRRSA